MNKNIREKKGNSLIKLPDSYSIIDIETTGLDPDYDYILEISAIKVKNNKIEDTFSSLVKYSENISDFITELTGITNEMVSNAPSLKNVLTNFINFIKDDILIGHNINFDINFLYDNCLKELKKPLTNDFVDTLRISRRLNKEMIHHTMSDLLNLYNIDNSNQHRALNDCEYTFEIYNKMKNDIIQKYTSIDEFIKTQGIKFKAKDIKTTAEQFDIDNPFYNKQIVFTGTLIEMTRKEAMQLVANVGGINSDNVNKNTNFLILGIQDYKKIKNKKSNKIKKAEELILKGYDLKIISENTFYDIMNIPSSKTENPTLVSIE